MAIKTKKISDLKTLINGDNVDNNMFDNTNFLCSYNNETGIVLGSAIVARIMNQIGDIQPQQQVVAVAATATEEPSKCEDCEALKSEVATLKNDLASFVKSYEFYTKSISDTVNKLSQENAKFKRFIMDLQKDGYLTLAEIKKAAQNCCPVE